MTIKAEDTRVFKEIDLAVDPILRYFEYEHLPQHLQPISMTFCGLAKIVVTQIPRNAERSVALRKLLEAKDAAVRASLS